MRADELERAGRSSIEIRIGVHTGEVVALSVGEGSNAGWEASGPAVALAARMEQSAQPGTIQLSASSFKLVAPWCEAQGLPAVTVKGFADPIVMQDKFSMT